MIEEVDEYTNSITQNNFISVNNYQSARQLPQIYAPSNIIDPKNNIVN